MAFLQRLTKVFPGLGVPLSNDAVYVQSAVALSTTSQQSNPIPATGSLAPTTTTGKIRLKIYTGGGTSPTLIDILVTATDGTSTVTVFVLHPNTAVALGSNIVVDLNFDYILDINATSFAVKTTLGGTTPTASLDMEICPLS